MQSVSVPSAHSSQVALTYLLTYLLAYLLACLLTCLLAYLLACLLTCLLAYLPGVGANLNDHPDFVMKFRCQAPVTLYPQTKPLASVMAGIQWLLTRQVREASSG